MDYNEALKQAKAVKTKENFITVKIDYGYDSTIVLPFKDGLLFMSAIEKAEILKEPYTEQTRITELDRKSIVCSNMSYEEYIRIKIAALLGIKPDEVNPTLT